ncbi:MAG TPA: hypothetical protein EYG11_05580 [Candidatus Latescibacteria bacterium]|nr:hypothetical protein [Candidatus Handelsmanbacteria bacterium]HIL08152.1 hypothetical protein [Candidatus Latescibacterota bacterium]
MSAPIFLVVAVLVLVGRCDTIAIVCL